ncbi:MAG: BrnA antitoxin family protein [Coriobacteriales bacterium]|jgi:hypothetical protein|nr:BrnA antitoxin family protein [Coriobacteriales bacterium]
MTKQVIDAEELDRMFDEGDERYLDYFDFSKTTRPGLEQEKVSISLPKWMLSSLDKEAERIGVNRQAVIKMWLDEKIATLSA